MDKVIIAIAVLSLLTLTAIGGIGIRRWAQTGYRFRLKTLLSVTAAASVLSYVSVVFILPRMQRQWAVHVVQQSRESFYRGEVKRNSVEIIKLNDPWSEKEAVEFENDFEATSSANVLNFLPELRSIEFGEKVTDIGIKSVMQEKVGVQELSFQCPNMTDASIENIGRLHSLESLMFVSSGITDKGLGQLSALQGPKSLYLYEYVFEKGKRNRNRFGPAEYRAIGQLKNLINMRLKGYVVTDESALHLHNLSRLKKLDFVYCVISGESLASLRLALPECDIKASHCVEPDAPKPDWY